jgi:chromosomal replication initiation ATPase DnaA
VKATLKAALSDAAYTSWIAPLVLLHVEVGLVVIAAPNCFVHSELQNTYVSALQGAMEAASPQRVLGGPAGRF